jgi:hypothetical protein
MTALYPAMFAIDERASYVWALESLGTYSIPKDVIFLELRISRSGLFWAGLMKLMRPASFFIFWTSSEVGGRTFKIKSELRASSLLTILAPTFSYVESAKSDSAPAPCSMFTLNPSFTKRSVASGDRATLLSFSNVSFGIPIVVSVTLLPNVANYLI